MKKESKPTIRETHRKFSISKKRREFSNSLLKSLVKKPSKRLKEGEIYCIKYNSNSKPTDKWHAISIFYVTEIHLKKIVGYNLLYLPTDVLLNLLDLANDPKKKKNDKVAIIDSEFVKKPYVYLKKELETQFIVSCALVERDNWGMIACMEKSVFGDLNPKKLERDWEKENAAKPIDESKKEKDEKEVEKVPTFTVEENLNGNEVVFGEKAKTVASMMQDLGYEDEYYFDI